MGHREPEKDRGAWLSRITIAAVLCANLVTSLTAADLVSFPDLGLRLQRGFNIRLVADSDTAPDTWCMTFDASGMGQPFCVTSDTRDSIASGLDFPGSPYWGLV